MKINAVITMLAGDKGLSIEIRDESSARTFVRVQLNPVQFSRAMGRLAYCDVEECEVFNLDVVGKKMEHKELEFPMPKHDFSDMMEKAVEESAKHIPEGWQSDGHFSSKDSFFTKDGVDYARVTIRRWIDVDGVDERVV